MGMILCYTNIFIEIYRRNIAVRSELERIGYGNIMVSDVTRAELYYGAINKSELQKIRKDMSGLTVLPIHSEISEMAVNLVEQYCLSHKMDIEDALIASTAIFHRVKLFTLNIKDFAYIPTIKLHEYQNK